MTAAAHYTVRVRDTVDADVAGHAGQAYVSPPQPREHALALVALLLGGAAPVSNGADSWMRAIAGGQRTITLTPAATPAGGTPPGGAPRHPA